MALLIIFGTISVISIIAFIVARACWVCDFSDWLTPISVFVCISSLLLTLGLGVTRIEYKYDCLAFEETKTIIAEVTTNADDLESIGLISTIIEKNTWLVKAKSSVRKYGVWSLAYGLDIENMEYICLDDL